METQHNNEEKPGTVTGILEMVNITMVKIKPKTIRAVITDLDGTLLGTDKSISSQMEAVVRKLESRGIFFSFITGRPKQATERFAKQLRLQAPIVSCNGAILFHGDKTISRHSFPLLSLREIVEEAGRLGITVLYYTGDVEYAMSPTQWVKKRNQTGRGYPVRSLCEEEWSTLKAEKVNLMAPGSEGEFLRLLPLIQSVESQYSVAYYGAEGCEIVAGGINKYQGMRELSSYLNIPVDEFLAVGDNNNDIEMLTHAGLGAAVGNASQEAKAAADYICSGERTEGVIEAICQFVLKEE